MRLNRYIARSGVTSRRKAEELILSGKVKINGATETALATEVKENAVVTVNGKRVELPDFRYYALNKPSGYTVTKDDPFARHTIFELLPNDSSLFPVGRLDRETTGLILVTNDGNFSQNIIHPTQKIEKEYLVRTKSPFSPEEIAALVKGVELEDGAAKATSAEQLAERDIRLVIEMGRKRVVRRMIQSFGNKVMGLKRERIGSISLGDLETGKFRELTEKEVAPYV